MALDKITPLAAPPGHSLTGPRGKWAWERPPQFSNPDDAIDHVISQIDNPKTQDSLVKLMLAGITVEELVSQMAFKGFSNGYFNPDVAELIKPALGIYLMGLAEDSGFEAKMFVSEPEQEEVDDTTFYKILKQRNPQLFKAMNEEINERKRMQEQEELAKVAPQPPMPESAPTFLNSVQEEEE